MVVFGGAVESCSSACARRRPVPATAARRVASPPSIRMRGAAVSRPAGQEFPQVGGCEVEESRCGGGRCRPPGHPGPAAWSRRSRAVRGRPPIRSGPSNDVSNENTAVSATRNRPPPASATKTGTVAGQQVDQGCGAAPRHPWAGRWSRRCRSRRRVLSGPQSGDRIRGGAGEVEFVQHQHRGRRRPA